MQSEYQRSLYTLFALKFVLIKPYCFLHYKSSASNLFHGVRMPNTYPEASVAQGPKRITQLKPPGGLHFDSSDLSQLVDDGAKKYSCLGDLPSPSKKSETIAHDRL